MTQYKLNKPHLALPTFGSLKNGRNFSVGSGYRFGFNGKEKDMQILNDAYDFGARIYDGRLGRWMSLDPLMTKYPNQSPYDFTINNPLVFVDSDGKDIFPSVNFSSSLYYSTVIKAINNKEQLGILSKALAPYIANSDKNLFLNFCLNPVAAKCPDSEPIYPDAQTFFISNGAKIVFSSNTTLYSNPCNVDDPMNPQFNYSDNFADGNERTEISSYATFLHELMHTKFGYSETADGHNSIANNDFEAMKQSLMAFAKLDGNPGITDDEAEALAWTGLEQTDAFKTKFGTSENHTDNQQKALSKMHALQAKLTWKPVKNVAPAENNIAIDPINDQEYGTAVEIK